MKQSLSSWFKSAFLYSFHDQIILSVWALTVFVKTTSNSDFMESTTQSLFQLSSWNWKLSLPGSLLPSMGDWFLEETVGTAGKPFFMPLGGIFLRWAAESLPNNQKISWLMFYWKHSLPVSEKKKVPDFSVDFGTNWADTREIWSYFDIQTWYKNCAKILDQFLYLYSLIFLQHPLRSCLPYVWSSLWATSRPLTSCIFPLLAICSPAWPFFWSEAKCWLTRHMSEQVVSRVPIACLSSEFIYFISVNIMLATVGRSQRSTGEPWTVVFLL